jgi:hypothetical protein
MGMNCGWVMTVIDEKIIQVSEMRFLRYVDGEGLLNIRK